MATCAENDFEESISMYNYNIMHSLNVSQNNYWDIAWNGKIAIDESLKTAFHCQITYVKS